MALVLRLRVCAGPDGSTQIGKQKNNLFTGYDTQSKTDGVSKGERNSKKRSVRFHAGVTRGGCSSHNQQKVSSMQTEVGITLEEMESLKGTNG